jgi:hypothetical protein
MNLELIKWMGIIKTYSTGSGKRWTPKEKWGNKDVF